MNRRNSNNRGSNNRGSSNGSSNNKGSNNRNTNSKRRNHSKNDDREENRNDFNRNENRRPSSKFGRTKPNENFRNFRKKKKKAEPKVDDGTIRLNRYIANAGICSRREADELIKTGVVDVNGKTITEMGYRVKPGDEVRFDGKKIYPDKKTYILLNKPKGFITTTKDEKDRKTVMDLVGNATKARIFPVGRLDRQTTGVLLFTNDGYMAKKLTHPSHNVRKIYHVVLDKNLHGDDMDKIREGIRMFEGVAKVDKISFIESKPHNEVGVEIHIGWNRVVRRLFEKLGYKIVSLDRVSFAGLTKKNVKRGHWRILDEQEVNFLKML